ncbi:MAG: alginate lyase family protein, partial [Candidatus Marinimicrobia bacterium]|nr:alginate lyase family protein [Candidatus Neomarinimicrobiota bacterium]
MTRFLAPSLISLLVLISCYTDSNSKIPPRVLFNDPAVLLETRERALSGDTELAKSINQLMTEAEQIMLIKDIYSVMDKPFTPLSGDKHDYMSVGPFWWPDPEKEDGLPYIRRDGEVNPERELYDTTPLRKLAHEVSILSASYFFLNDEKYAERATTMIRAWFLDEKTRMNPHLNYAQAIPGKTAGRGIGIIDSRSFFEIVEAIGFITSSESWTGQDEAGLKKWFAEYVKWLMESENGIDEEDALNNHGTWYDVILSSLALYSGQDEIAKKVITAFPEHRIIPQIQADGSQPRELSRTRSFHYSTMNLKGMYYIAMLGEKVGVRILNPDTEHGQLVKKALDYLIPYLSRIDEWPYEQLRGWEFDDSRSLAMILKLSTRYFDEPAYLALIDSIPAIDSLE